MPIYEYKCQDCQTIFELLLRRSARDEATSCPACGGADAERMMSSFVGRIASGKNTSRMIAGSSSCSSCQASSCAGCRR